MERYRAVLLVAAAFLIFVQLTVLIIEIPVALQGRTDFRHFYTAGYLVRTGQGSRIYDYGRTVEAEKEVAGNLGPDLPYTHPAFEALPFAVISKLPYRTAFWVYAAFSVVVFALTLWLLRATPVWMKGMGSALPLALIAGFLPVGICLIEGQDSLVLLAVVAASFVLQESGEELAAGLTLGLAVFRFQFLLPFVLYLIFQKRWKFLAGLVVTSGVAVAISLAVAGAGSLSGYPTYLAAMSVGLTEVQKKAMGVWPLTMPNLRGLLSLLQLDGVSARVALIVTAAGTIGLLAWSIVKKLPFELLAVVAVLTSYHGEIHDSVLLLLPLLRCKVAAERPLQFWSWLAVLVLPSVAFVGRIPFAALAAVYLGYLATLRWRGDKTEGSA